MLTHLRQRLPQFARFARPFSATPPVVSSRLFSAPSLDYIDRRGFRSIPIIDVGPLTDGSSSKAEREAVGAQLHNACRDVGFFYIKNHGIDEELVQRLRDLSREWFALPAEVKAEISLSTSRDGYRGYQFLGENVTRYENTEGGISFQRDWHEAIDLYKHFDENHPDVLAGRPIHSPNPWPTQVEGYKNTIERYVDECVTCGANILQGIALGLKLPEDFFAGERAGDPFWVLRIIHYPPLDSAEVEGGADAEGVGDDGPTMSSTKEQHVDRSVQLSCGEHTDYGLLTLVNQDTHVSALQVQNAAGEWVEAAPIEGTMVCNIGDMFQVWTNGLYTPTKHRVINHASGCPSRISVPFFYEPNFEANVHPLPEFCSAERPPRYPEVMYGDHLLSKVSSNFEVIGEKQ